jgi:protein gp37
MSKIEWTDQSWNCITGCTRYSAGCINCYAARMALRLKAMGQEKYANGFDLTIHEDTLEQPLGWKKPRRIFVNSMSDTFHEDVPVDFICRMFHVMNRAHWHQFQVLTKRSERLFELSSRLHWGENIWMGVTVEHANYLNRIDDLRATDAKIKFLSLEPLLSPMPEPNLDGIDWVIVGGESGPGARPMNEDWVIDIRNQCIEKGVAFFFKQWGGVNKKKAGRMLDGRTWDEYPDTYSKSPVSDTQISVYDYIDCLTSEEKSMLLLKVPETQLSQLFRAANFSVRAFGFHLFYGGTHEQDNN